MPWTPGFTVPYPNPIEDEGGTETPGDGGGVVDSITPGDHINVDATDPANPEVSVDASSLAADAALTGAFQRVYVHDGSAYVLAGGRVFVGPEDPEDDGFTPVDGDFWEDGLA